MELEDMVRKLAAEEAAKATAPLERRLDIAEKIIKETDNLITATKAKEKTGIGDNRTLRKYLTEHKRGNRSLYSNAEIIRKQMEGSLPKAPQLYIQKDKAA